MIRLLLAAFIGYLVGAYLAVLRDRRERQQWDEASRQQDAAHGMDDREWLGEWAPFISRNHYTEVLQ